MGEQMAGGVPGYALGGVTDVDRVGLRRLGGYRPGARAGLPAVTPARVPVRLPVVVMRRAGTGSGHVGDWPPGLGPAGLEFPSEGRERSPAQGRAPRPVGAPYTRSPPRVHRLGRHSANPG